MKKFKIYKLVLIVFLSSLYSCVSNKAKYRGDWERNDLDEKAFYTLYLIGDAGNVSMGQSSVVLDHLKLQLDNTGSNSAIVWLGDNIYPIGLAPQSSPYYPEGRHRLMAQLESMSSYQGQKFFVPGNHDWYTYGRVGLRRQELLVDSFLTLTPNPNRQSNFFLPDKGCGDPQVVELYEGIGLLLMDSHWFLNEKARSGDQSVCNVDSPQSFLKELKYEINLHKEKSLIIASHHPPYTYAHHGGKFPLKDELFPLTQAVDWLYLPLPFTGVVFNRMRLRVSEQDVYHPLYQDYRNNLASMLKNKGRSIVASGHEHTLQYIENDNQYYIVSGAGSKNNKVGMGKGSKFAIGERGYVKIVFQDSKNAILQFIVPGQYEDEGNVAYEKRVVLE